MSISRRLILYSGLAGVLGRPFLGLNASANSDEATADSPDLFFIPDTPKGFEYCVNVHLHPFIYPEIPQLGTHNAPDYTASYTEMLMRMNMGGWMTCDVKRSTNFRAGMQKHPEFCVGMGELSFDNVAEDLKCIDTYRQAGILGLGEIKPIGVGKPFDDPMYDPIYEKAQELGMFCFFHTNPSKDYQQGKMDPARLVKVAERFSRLNVVAAHFGSEGYQSFMKGFDLFKQCVRMVRGLPNYYGDVAIWALFRLGAPYDRFLQAIRESYTEESDFDHMLFGTDFLEIEAVKLKRMVFQNWLNQLGLKDETRQNVLWKNAHRILGWQTDAPPRNPLAV